MIDYDKFESLKKNIAYSYSIKADQLAIKFENGTVNLTDKIRFMFVTRAVKTLDLQNVKPNATQIAEGRGDYNESLIQKSTKRINHLLRCSYELPIINKPNVS